MPSGVKCAFCGKTGRTEDYVFDSETSNYYCSDEHATKVKEISMLVEKAHEKGLVLCDNCLKEIKPDSYVCKYCGKVRVIFKDYVVKGMCPFTQVQIGSTQFGSGNYVWQHTECMKEYCVLWDSIHDKCSFLLRQ
jgi:hypothetical protein